MKMISFISVAPEFPRRRAVFLEQHAAAFTRRHAVFLTLFVLLRVHDNAFVKGQAFYQGKFDDMVLKMEMDVIDLARAVEEAYAKKCELDTINECEQGNYLDCIASFPKQECRGGLDYSSPLCNGSGNNSSTTNCSSFYDFSIS